MVDGEEIYLTSLINEKMNAIIVRESPIQKPNWWARSKITQRKHLRRTKRGAKRQQKQVAIIPVAVTTVNARKTINPAVR